MESSQIREEDNGSDAMIEDESLLFYASDKKKSYNPDFKDPLAEELQIDPLYSIKPWIPFEDFYNEPLSDAIEMDNDCKSSFNIHNLVVIHLRHRK